MGFEYIELVFENMMTIKISEEDILELFYNDIVYDEEDVIVKEFKLVISQGFNEKNYKPEYSLKEYKDKFSYIQNQDIASFVVFYDNKEDLYYVDYDNNGYINGRNMNQKINIIDNNLYIEVCSKKQ